MEHIRHILTKFGFPMINYETIYMEIRLALSETVNYPFAYNLFPSSLPCPSSLTSPVHEEVTNVLSQRVVISQKCFYCWYIYAITVWCSLLQSLKYLPIRQS